MEPYNLFAVFFPPPFFSFFVLARYWPQRGKHVQCVFIPSVREQLFDRTPTSGVVANFVRSTGWSLSDITRNFINNIAKHWFVNPLVIQWTFSLSRFGRKNSEFCSESFSGDLINHTHLLVVLHFKSIQCDTGTEKCFTSPVVVNFANVFRPPHQQKTNPTTKSRASSCVESKKQK